MLRFLTAGESHGEGLSGILEGFPKGVRIDKHLIDAELARRQAGYGRGARMAIEKDTAHFTGGLRAGRTLGSPIQFFVKNKDKTFDSFDKDRLDIMTVPRPAHADLAGALKYADPDVRNMLERASARNTAPYVVVGSLCRQLLSSFGYDVASHVTALGGIECGRSSLTVRDIRSAVKDSRIGCVDSAKEKRMISAIDKAAKAGDTLGGIVEIVAEGIPVGLGSFMHWDRRLDTRLAAIMMSIPAVKGVEIGLGFDYARVPGSKSHDIIAHTAGRGFRRETNNSGGVEGGMSNGEPLLIRIAMKPIATLRSGLATVDLKTRKKAVAPAVRSDVTAVTACGVIAEALVSFVITDLFLEKFSADTLPDIRKNFTAYMRRISR